MGRAELERAFTLLGGRSASDTVAVNDIRAGSRARPESTAGPSRRVILLLQVGSGPCGQQGWTYQTGVQFPLVSWL